MWHPDWFTADSAPHLMVSVEPGFNNNFYLNTHVTVSYTCYSRIVYRDILYVLFLIAIYSLTGLRSANAERGSESSRVSCQLILSSFPSFETLLATDVSVTSTQGLRVGAAAAASTISRGNLLTITNLSLSRAPSRATIFWSYTYYSLIVKPLDYRNVCYQLEMGELVGGELGTGARAAVGVLFLLLAVCGGASNVVTLSFFLKKKSDTPTLLYSRYVKRCNPCIRRSEARSSGITNCTWYLSTDRAHDRRTWIKPSHAKN